MSVLARGRSGLRCGAPCTRAQWTPLRSTLYEASVAHGAERLSAENSTGERPHTDRSAPTTIPHLCRLAGGENEGKTRRRLEILTPGEAHDAGTGLVEGNGTRNSPASGHVHSRARLMSCSGQTRLSYAPRSGACSSVPRRSGSVRRRGHRSQEPTMLPAQK